MRTPSSLANSVTFLRPPRALAIGLGLGFGIANRCGGCLCAARSFTSAPSGTLPLRSDLRVLSLVDSLSGVEASLLRFVLSDPSSGAKHNDIDSVIDAIDRFNSQVIFSYVSSWAVLWAASQYRLTCVPSVYILLRDVPVHRMETG